MDPSPTHRPIFRLAAKPSPRERLRIVPATTSADFTSQMIAGGDEQPTRQALAAMEQATLAYDRGARITVRRMPAGYRKTIIT